jgi:ribulose-phosphate 3-epimerase
VTKDPSKGDCADRAALKAWIRQTAPQVSVGLMAADAMAYGQAIRSLEAADLHFLHFDIMDGVFCPQMTAGPAIVKAASTRMFKDVHLMIADPLAHLGVFIAAGADIIHVHAESQRHLHRVLVEMDVVVAGNLSSRRILRGVALNPGTSVDCLRPVLHLVDVVTLLAVDPGWGGGGPDVALTDKIALVRKMAAELGVDPLLCVDGGITPETYPRVAALAPDVIVSGSALFKKGASVTENLRALVQSKA